MRNSNKTNYLWPVTGLAMRGLSAVATVLVVFSLPNVAAAQEGGAGALLEEIVTTARKKSDAEAVQDVPVALTAYGAAQLDALFVKKLSDLSYVMPNVQMEAVGTFPGVQNFSIRGQGINSSIPSVDPTVGVFVDGIYLGTTYGVVLDTFDVERIEVLRGPQGLLFGRNVTGGAVIIRNARPDGEPGLRLRAGITDEEHYNLATAIEGWMIQDKLAGKLMLYYDDDHGYFKNTNQSVPVNPAAGAFPAPHPAQPFYFEPAVRSDTGKMTTRMARPSMTWMPNDTVEVFTSFEYGESKGDGASWTNVTAQRAGAQSEYETTADEIGFTDMVWNQAVVEVNVAEVGDGTLTNILGWRRVNADSATDIDGQFLPIFAAGGFTTQHQLSNEIRWSGSFTDNWESTIGFYYFDQDITYREGRYIWNPAIGNLQRALGGDMDGRNFGAFWNNDYHVSDNLTVSAGIRYTDESKGTNIISGVGGGCTDVVTFNCTFDFLKGDWDNITPKLGFQWRFGDNSHVYGFWSKGYRSGGFNFRNAKPNVIPPGPTVEEENNTFEVGLKTDFMDGRMRLNVAAFQNDIQDMQRELNIGDPDVVVLQATINAGDVTINGFEVDFVALVMDNVSINVSAGIQDGEYDSINPLVPAIEAALGGATVIGPDLPRLAPSNYSAGVSWDVPLGDGMLNFATNYSWREGHPYNDSNSELYEDQKRWNASANWYLPGDNWEVSLYGKNLNDQANWGNLTSISGLYTAGPMQKGRVLGLEVNYRR